MLAKRVIPVMLVRGRTLVKGKQFAGDRSIGHVLQAARIHAAREVDELMCLDISATAEGRGPDLDMVRELSDGCFIPITIGGGVRKLSDIDDLLRAGADKVCICSAIFDSCFVGNAAARFGSQAIVCCIEHYRHLIGRGGTPRFDGKLHPEHPAKLAEHLAEHGAGEILLSSVERDGTMQGYDLELIRYFSAAVDIPVIASGGCSSYENMAEAFAAGASACAAGALFAFTDNTPKGAAKFLKAQGVPVRL